MAARPGVPNSQAAIFARVWQDANGEMPVTVARHVLKLGFNEGDKARMRELLDRNRKGTITDQDREELDNFVKVGDLLAILQSKARKLLKRTPVNRAGHG